MDSFGSYQKKSQKKSSNTKKTSRYGLKRLLGLVLLLSFVPQIASAQTVNVGGNVSSKVSASLSSVAAEPITLTANGTDTSVVTVILKDSSSIHLSNIEVTLSSNRSSADTIGHYIADTLTPGNSHTTDVNGVVRFGVRSSTSGNSTLTAIAESLVTLNDKPNITFTVISKEKDTAPKTAPKTELPPTSTDAPSTTQPSADEAPPPPSKPELDPTEEDSTKGSLSRVIEFLENNQKSINTIIAAVGGLTTLALLPTIIAATTTAILQKIPLLNILFARWIPLKRKRKWGTVRDRSTGLPVAGAVVRLFQQNLTEPIDSLETDQTGQYSFTISSSGEYFLAIDNPLYLPYRSSNLNIESPSQVISLDTPLEPNEKIQARQMLEANRYSKLITYLNYFHIIILSIGTALSLYVFYFDPTMLAGAIVALYTLIWGAKVYHYISYRYLGTTIDIDNNSPVTNSMVQIASKNNGVSALVYSTITDKKGRFLFVVKPSSYSLVVTKKGYEPAELEITSQNKLSSINLRRIS